MKYALLLLLLLSGPLQAKVLDVKDPWVRLVPPGGNSAGYMELTNKGSQTVVLTGVRSRDVKDISIHKTLAQQGRVSMYHVPSLSLNPGQRLTLAPGGLHLMLMDIVKPLKEGQPLRLELIFADGQTQEIEAWPRYSR
ncbi:copper chaperone PCu(A)C [Gallaecimonas pentaromativorans]|uniref:copper chaperone PCu(A)C n=1 Tax=Gallaecimonas pentaromativorans TaxID=584787 RepID=UPI003A8FD3EB